MQDEENFDRSTPLHAHPAPYILTARDPQVYWAGRHRKTIDPRALAPIGLRLWATRTLRWERGATPRPVTASSRHLILRTFPASRLHTFIRSSRDWIW